MSSSLPSIQLIYFNIEGRAEAVRLAFKLAHVPFEDKRIAYDEWSELKPQTPYGQVPVMSVNGGPYQAQSSAILRWAATLQPERVLYPPDKVFEIEDAIALIEDMQNSFAPALYMGMRPHKYGHPEGYSKTPEGAEKVKEMRQKWISEELPKYLDFIVDKIDKNGGTWLASGGSDSEDKPTVADCVAVPALRSFTKGHVDHVDTGCLNSHPKIVAYIKRFCALPEIQGWYSDGVF